MTDAPKKKPLMTVDANSADQRLDNFLFRHFKHAPRTLLHKWIRTGQIRINMKRARAQSRLCAGDEVRVPPKLFFADDAAPAVDIDRALAQRLCARVLYADDAFMVIDKPAGTPVHAGTGHAAGLIETLRATPPYTADLQPAHRLDLGTSGCLLLCRSRAALHRFQAWQQSGQVHKTYVAVLRGHLRTAQRVERALKVTRQGAQPVHCAVDGKAAVTEFTPLKSGARHSLVECRLLTGRKHQIRVHAAAMGHPVLGDRTYGPAGDAGAPRLLLHASALRIDNTAIDVVCPLPQEFIAHVDS